MYEKSVLLIALAVVLIVQSVPLHNQKNEVRLSVWPADTSINRIDDKTFTLKESRNAAVNRPLIISDRLPAARRSNNDLDLGELVPGSAFSLGLGIIVLPSDTLPVSSSWSYYTNGRLFSRIEFRDRNTNGTGGQVRILDGGIGSDFFSFRIDSIGVGFGIDTHVTFYVQADIQLTVGTLADRSVLMTTERINVTAVEMQISNGTVHYAGDGGVRRISFVDAIDQSVDDSGRFMNMSGAVGGNEIELFFTVNRLLFPSRGIHFLTYVYGEATIANEDFRYGQIVRATELLYRIHLQREGSNLGEQLLQETVTYAGNQTITMIQGLDQRLDGTGATLAAAGGGVGDQSVTLIFSEKKQGFGMDVIVEIYGV